jgi:hypothetical protein
VYFVQFAYRDKKVVGVFIAFSCAIAHSAGSSSISVSGCLRLKRAMSADRASKLYGPSSTKVSLPSSVA